MTDPVASLILCEGYYDRAFWSGFLLSRGWIDPGSPAGNGGGRRRVLDPWGKAVAGGRFLFRWEDPKSGPAVIVEPCHGETLMGDRLSHYLGSLADHAYRKIVFNEDGDVYVHGDGDWRQNFEKSVEGLVKRHDGEATYDDGRWELNIGARQVDVIPFAWHAGDDPPDNVPTEPNMEALVCAAITAVHPDRGEGVQDWLTSRSDPKPDPISKSYSWSHMAGWYPERGCEDFYRNAIWEDEGVKNELIRLLDKIGAVKIEESLR